MTVISRILSNGDFKHTKMTVNSEKIMTKKTVILNQNDRYATIMTVITQNDFYLCPK